MARSGGLLGKLREAAGGRYANGGEMIALAGEFREWALLSPESNRWGLPPDQIALASFAAARVAPTILRRAGLDPADEERGRLVAGYLLTVWSNALLTLDGPLIEKLAAGNSATDSLGSEPIVTHEGGTDGDPDPR